MQQDAARGKWYNLVELQRVPEFAAWLADGGHAWLSQIRRQADYLQQACHGAVVHILQDCSTDSDWQ